MKTLSKIVLLSAVLACILFSSCSNCKVADYPRNVRIFYVSGSTYILYWDKDPDASEYTVYTIYDDEVMEKRKTENNWYKGYFYSWYKYGVSMTIDGEESYVSDFVTTADSEK